LPYEIDGIVLKVNTLAGLARHPRSQPRSRLRRLFTTVPCITPAETGVESHHRAFVGRNRRLTPLDRTRTGLCPRLDHFLRHANCTTRRNPRKGHPHRDTVVIRKAGMR